MNIISKLVGVSLVATGALGAGVAQARTDVQWSVQVGGPIGVAVGSQPYVTYARPVAVPVYVQPGYVQPGYGQAVYGQPVYVQAPYAQPVYGWRGRYDRVYYNPRWDRDGDGIPNRYDRHDNRRDFGRDRRDDRREDRRDDRWDDRADHHHGGR